MSKGNRAHVHRCQNLSFAGEGACGPHIFIGIMRNKR